MKAPSTPPRIVVVDIDGTLSDSSAREHHILNGDFDAFHELCHQDPPNRAVVDLLDMLEDNGVRLIALTGRPEKYRGKTEAWMIKHMVPVDQVVMRGNNDYGSDIDIKPANLREAIAEYTDAPLEEAIWFVLEDRDKVVERWRELGLNCWQVKHGGY
jgi:hypothetical protein